MTGTPPPRFVIETAERILLVLRRTAHPLSAHDLSVATGLPLSHVKVALDWLKLEDDVEPCTFGGGRHEAWRIPDARKLRS